MGKKKMSQTITNIKYTEKSILIDLGLFIMFILVGIGYLIWAIKT